MPGLLEKELADRLLTAAIVDLAAEIADALFTAGGTNTKAEFLKLYRGERYLCGWSQNPARDRIAEIICQKLKTQM